MRGRESDSAAQPDSLDKIPRHASSVPLAEVGRADVAVTEQRLNLTRRHALAVQALPDIHRDPFDRLLIAQAKHEGFKLVSRDTLMPRYGVAQIVA
jgi:PIN domain nuclease of toxin-antitoxin system